jgi:predicted phage-related endonuclease
MEPRTGNRLESAGVSTVYFKTETEWLESQKKGITSREAAAIMGYSPWGDSSLVYSQKLGLTPAPEPTPASGWLRRLTPAIATKFEEVTKHDLYDLSDAAHYRVTINDQWPASRTTLDRLIVTYPDHRGVLAIRTGRSFDVNLWKQRPPPEYWAEVQHQMAVGNLEFGAVAVLLGGCHFVSHMIPRDEGFIHRMMDELERFWQENILCEHPPELAPPKGGPA